MKTFKQFINENILLDGVEFILTKHFKERLKERKEFSNLDFSNFLKSIRSKLSEINPEGYFCFTSKSLEQSIIAFWDAIKEKMTLVTLLPKDEKYIKKDTEKVFVESIQKEVFWIEVE